MDALVTVAQQRVRPAGSYVFVQGEPARLLFVIKAGRIKLTKTDAEGNEILVDIRKAGDFLGETFLSEDGDYPLTAECVEDSLLCGLSRESFERLVTQRPNIGLQIMRTMSERIDWLTSRVGDLASTHLEERLYAVLTTVAREHGTRTEAGLVIEFPLTHEELSFLVGAHRVSVTRALKSLRASGKVLREGGRLVLPAR
jgi:CRP/FNR family transcriptional regulator